MPPTIESAPFDTQVVIGNSVSISCSASGVPLPNITWSRVEHEELMNHTDTLIIASVQDDNDITSLLTIVNAVQENTGYYNCTAENNIGRDSVIFHLQVQGMLYYDYMKISYVHAINWRVEQALLVV